MTIRPIAAATCLLAASSMAQAPTSRAYLCKNGSDSVRLLIGDGEVSYWARNQEWSVNWCDPVSGPQVPCRFSGSRFQGQNDELKVDFDSATGEISIDIVVWDGVFKGVCRPV